MPIHEIKPFPRILLINMPEGSEKVIYDSGAGSVRSIEEDEIDEVRENEYDVIITHGIDIELSPGRHVINLGGTSFGYVQDDVHRIKLEVRGIAPSTEFWIPDAEDETLTKLAEVTLLPAMKKYVTHRVLTALKPNGYGGNILKDYWTPIVTTSDKKDTLAGYVLRGSKSVHEQWYFPSYLPETSLKLWMKYLYERWSAIDPVHFPSGTDWEHSESWYIHSEIEQKKLIDDENSRFETAKSVHESTVEGLKNDLNRITLDEGTASRRLLTAKSEPLKQEVIKVLTEFNFTCIDQDEEQERGDLLEDIRVSISPNPEPSEIYIVEVKGYSKGAKVIDLQRLARQMKRFMNETAGIPPAGQWFITNHNIKSDPSSRPLPLSNNPKDIGIFAEDGLVIDTVQLFILKRALNSGSITEDQIRNVLTTQTGHLDISTLIPTDDSK